MLPLISSQLNLTPPSPLTQLRDVCAVVRALNVRAGTQDKLHRGEWYSDGLIVSGDIAEAAMSEYGVMQSGNFSLRFAKSPSLTVSEPEPRITYRTYITTGHANDFAYTSISSLAHTIQPGDVLEFDVQVDAQSASLTAHTGGFDIGCGPVWARDVGLVDQFGYGITSFNASAQGAVGNWVTRRVDLSQLAGNVTQQWTVVNESDADGTYNIAHYRNIRVTDGAGRTRCVVWASGTITPTAIFNSGLVQATVTGPEALKFEVYTPSVVAVNCYTYHKVGNAAGRVIASGDVLECDVFVPATTADITNCGSIDIDFTDGSTSRSYGVVDQFGMGGYVFNPNYAGAVGDWVRRRIPLTGGCIGKTIANVNLVSESEVSGRHTAYYRDIMITDGNGYVRQAIYIGSNPTHNALSYQNANFGNTVTVVNSARNPGSAEEFFAQVSGQKIEVDLITTKYREDGTTTDVISEICGQVESVRRTRDGYELNCVSIDHAVLATQFPSRTYTVANFANLYADHVNRPVAQGVGYGSKIPATYIDNTVGAYRYAICEIPAGAGTPTLETIYRGDQHGKGEIVPTSEYTTGTLTAGGATYFYVQFVKEQRGFRNQLHTIDADITMPGSRIPSDEMARLITAAGGSTSANSFANAAAWLSSYGVFVDSWYTVQRPLSNYLNDLALAAMGWLSVGVGGVFNILVDQPRTITRAYIDTTDTIDIESVHSPSVPKSITLRCQPKVGEREYGLVLTRTTTGSGPEKIIQSDVVIDPAAADRLIDYTTKRAQRKIVSATIYGDPVRQGDVLAITSDLLDGTARCMVTDVQRGANSNSVTMELLSASDYTYTDGTIPAGATNGRQPDYSFTKPAAPTGVTVVSQGITVTNGFGTAYALIRAVPPSVNWAKMTATIKSVATSEQYAAQLVLNAGNYEATIPGLRANAAHTVTVVATNASNLEGLASSPVSFTSAAYTAAPAAPNFYACWQTGVAQITGYFGASTGGATIDYYQVFVSATSSSGPWTQLPNAQGESFNDSSFGTGNYGYPRYYKVHAVDTFGNVSAASSVRSATPVAIVDSVTIISSGVSTNNIADDNVVKNKLKVYTVNQSASIGAGVAFGIGGSSHNFLPQVVVTAGGASIDLRGCGYPGVFQPSPPAAGIGYVNTSGGTMTVDIQQSYIIA